MTHSESIEKAIEQFFAPRISSYLDEKLQEVMKRISETKEREGSAFLNQFIRELEECDLKEARLPPLLSPIAEWKRAFTKEILVPDFINHTQPLSLEEIIHLIKRTCLNAAFDKKVSYYIQMCKRRLFRGLLNVEKKMRPLQAKRLIAKSADQFLASDFQFPKKQFLDAFQPEALKAFLDTIPPSTLEPELLDPPLLDLLEEQLRKILLKDNASLTQQLQGINHLLLNIKEKETSLLSLVQTCLPQVQLSTLSPNILESLFHVVQKIKGEVLAKSCYLEVLNAKEKADPSDFLKIRERMLQKYQASIIHDPLLKEFFFKAYRSLEIAKPPPEPTPPQSSQKPRRSLWRRA